MLTVSKWTEPISDALGRDGNSRAHDGAVGTTAANPLRPDGTLESAIHRPRMAAWYEDADIVRQATILGTGIAQAQAFLDGNKPTACVAMIAVLRLNDLAYIGDRLELAQQFEAFALRSPNARATDEFEAWLRLRVAAS